MSNDKKIRVMTVDDHEIMRGGIRFLLLAFDDLELVAEAHSGEEAVELCSKANLDVVLMDMKMTGMDGVATTKAIKESYPSVQVLALTSFYEADLVRRALDAGAVGYMLKDASKEELAEAIRAARAGRTTLSPNAASALAEKTDVSGSIGNDLTEREREILALLTEGLSNSQIAERLNRSPFTIRHHVSQVISKLGAANRAEAAALAIKHRLLRHEDGNSSGVQ
jgi:NarL family two-component system response regulator LiaR